MMSDGIQINENCTKQQQDTASKSTQLFFYNKTFPQYLVSSDNAAKVTFWGLESANIFFLIHVLNQLLIPNYQL